MGESVNTQNPIIRQWWQAAQRGYGLPRIAAAVFLLNRKDAELNWMEENVLHQYIQEGRRQLQARMYRLGRLL